MKILFSPSETKHKGGKKIQIDKNSFIFPELFEKRLEVINYYQEYIKKATNKELETIFGTKKEDIIEYYKIDIFSKELQKAILRYDGVAYDYITYPSLDKKAQEYIDKNTIIFSNLFGPILAGDIGLPDYKLQQNVKLGNFKIDRFYNEHFSSFFDKFLDSDDILDLRAGFYEKFYTIKKPYITMKFIKDGKVVSHWAKAYRGIVLKELAINSIKSIDELMDLSIENLSIKEILKQKNKTEIIYNII
ncbi:MAG: YaaA family protein [Arcobacteraceae bacterium]|jgi:cytoplasmic iron level regulating protein YaaA (DUF328/UPF0246 family)|nr:YaaA family protein [Arcobacteraceae bacterium]MDY0365268.1 YaaA family protein [Arcobacteraceae bacterium]